MEDALRAFGERIFDLPGYIVLGLVLLGFAGYLQRVYISGKKDYEKMFAPVAPTLEARPSPVDQVFKGSMGCLRAIIAFVLLLVFLFLAFDALFNEFDFLFTILNGNP